MRTLLGKFLAVITPVIALNSFSAPAKADMGAIYAQSAINMMTVTTNNSINENLTRRSVEMNRNSNRSSRSQGRTERSEPSRNSAKVAAVTIFEPDPAITTEILNDFANSVEDPIAKKFITRFLTSRNAKKLFAYFPAKEPLQTNDMVDVFTVASLLSFGFLENTPDITPAQIRSTRQMFRSRFAELSLSSAKMQRTTEFLLYWTTLNALAIKAEPKNENERRVAKNLTANAAIIMTTIGLSPQKYTLSDRGFVEK